MTIKRGVSLYSFQEEYFLRTMSLEDCIAAAADIGALGIEIIPEQSIPGYPAPHRRVRRARGTAGWRSTAPRRSPPTCSSTPSATRTAG